MQKGSVLATFLIAIVLIAAGIGAYIYFKSKNAPVAETTITEETVTDKTVSEEQVNIEGVKSSYGYIDIDALNAKKLIDNEPNLVIIDVSPNYAEGHLPGAINYYVGDGTLDKFIPSLDKSKKYLIYCHVDSASISGAEKMVDAGFDPVYRLKGNYSAWVDAGYPVEK